MDNILKHTRTQHLNVKLTCGDGKLHKTHPNLPHGNEPILETLIIQCFANSTRNHLRTRNKKAIILHRSFVSSLLFGRGWKSRCTVYNDVHASIEW